jgi:hypothetical protein
LPHTVLDALTRDVFTFDGCLRAALTWPLKLIWDLLKRLSKKILYFLTVKEATDQISHYWHQAFLTDYMLLVGHLNTVESTQIARQALDVVLQTTITSPLLQLAQQVVRSSSNIFRLLRRARKGEEDEALNQPRSEMNRHWADFSDYFEALAQQYEETCERIREERRRTEELKHALQNRDQAG